MFDIIREQIVTGLQKLHAAVEHVSYQELTDLRRELGILELSILQRQEHMRNEALRSKSKLNELGGK